MPTYTPRPSQQQQIADAATVFAGQRLLDATAAKQQEATLLRVAGATRQPIVTPSREALQRAFADLGAAAKSGAITRDQHIEMLAALLPFTRFS